MDQVENKCTFFRWKRVISLSVLVMLTSLASLPSLGDEALKAAATSADASLKTPISVVPEAKAENWWISAHDRMVKVARSSHPGVVVFGDSITQFMNVELLHNILGKDVENFGIAGDETQHLLYRLRNGELDFTAPKPKAFIMLIGTNNMTKWLVAPGQDPNDVNAKKIDVLKCTNQEVFLGVQACVNELRARMPGAKILVIGILPREHSADAPLRQRIKDINILLKKLADNHHIFYSDIGNAMLESNGTISRQVMFDYLHPTKVTGYTRMFVAIKPHLDAMLKH